MTPTSVFDLGRMRHLDLLALWHQLHPDGHHGHDCDPMGRARKGYLIAAILRGTP
jgi:hypothetical protein